MGCSSSRPAYNGNNYEVAWNEDTVNDYRLILSKKGDDFTYRVKDGITKTTKVFKGTFGGTDNELYLKFNGDKPEGLNPVVIIEGSNNYYIQYFTDGRKRMFLRIQRWPYDY